MTFGNYFIILVAFANVFGAASAQTACDVCSCQPSNITVVFFSCVMDPDLTALPANIPTSVQVILVAAKLEKITATDLQGLTLLRALQLNNNNISVIEAGAFEDLTSLQSLELTNNSIVGVTGTTLHGLESLTHMRIDGNMIDAVPDYMCSKLPSLQSLNAASNKIQTVGANVFFNCSSLSHIDISKNELTSIAEDAFKDLDDLATLDISGNSLTTFYSAWLVNKSPSINFDIDGSGWFCTTQLKTEYENMIATHPSIIGCDTQGSFCPTCANFGGRRLENLTMEELATTTTMPTTTTKSSNGNDATVPNTGSSTTTKISTTSRSEATTANVAPMIVLMAAYFTFIKYQ